MLLWVFLILGLLGLAASLSCLKWHNDLNKELDLNPKKVGYFDYIISGLCAYLGFPGNLFIIVGSIYCILAK